MLKPFLPAAEANAGTTAPGVRNAITGPLLLMAAVILWAWFPSLQGMVERWNSDPQYSHGFLVPIIAGMIVWYRREDVVSGDRRPCTRGLILVAAGVAGYLIGTRIYFEWLQLASMLPVLYGCTLLVGGVWLGRVSWPGIAFLLFMIPLPYFVEVAMAQPLQKVAGVASTFVLQTCGYAATLRGNLIDLDGYVLGVAEACSGLRMLVVFFAIAAAIAILSNRSWLHRFLLIVSAAPIALICNIGRITVTGMLHVHTGPEMAERVFHDFAGWLMMPAALLLMWLEIQYLNLVIDESAGRTAAGGQTTASVFGRAV